MDKSIDFSNIAYANSKSKLTVKTKVKLDEIAAQVNLWNQESFSRSRQNNNKDKKMSLNPRRSRVIFDDLSNPFHKDSFTTPPKTAIPDAGSVRKRAAYFESLVTPQKEIQPKIATPFKKLNKAAFFESLVTPSKDTVAQIMKANKVERITEKREVVENIDKENMYPADVCQESDSEESLPPPPPSYYSEEDTNEYTERTSVIASLSTESLLSEEFTQVSPMHDSISLLQDIYDELRKRNYMCDTDSVTTGGFDEDTDVENGENVARKVRRSLSWSEKVQYIDAQSDETEEEGEECVAVVKRHEEEEDDDETVDDDDVPEYDSLAPHTMSLAESDALDAQEAACYAKKCLEDFERLVRQKETRLGGKEHRETCLRLIEATLKQKSVAERAHIAPDSPCAIEGFLELRKVRLGLKPGFVLIDYDKLEQNQRADDLRRIKRLHHVVLLLRVHGNTMIRASHVYTLIHESEARKLSLPHVPSQFLEMFEYVRLAKLVPECAFDLMFYSMTVSPRKSDNGHVTRPHTPSRQHTPFKRLILGRWNSQDAVTLDHGPSSSSSSSLFFTNLGSVTIRARDIHRDRYQWEHNIVGVHTDCPFTSGVTFVTDMTLAMANEDDQSQPPCHGRLNIYSDVGGVGSWSFYQCKIAMTSVIGWRVRGGDRHIDRGCDDGGDGRDGDHHDHKGTVIPHLEIPFHLMMADTQLCDYTVCAKPHTFSVCLCDQLIVPSMTTNRATPHNRRMSTDGNNKTRFMAEADSYEHAQRWCRAINYGRQSLIRWATGVSV